MNPYEPDDEQLRWEMEQEERRLNPEQFTDAGHVSLIHLDGLHATLVMLGSTTIRCSNCGEPSRAFLNRNGATACLRCINLEASASVSACAGRTSPALSVQAPFSPRTSKPADRADQRAGAKVEP